MAPPAPVIRTPDQRLRVFVSSTLRELADERRVVRDAIERLRLAPVMFELGARPHPPRDLYRAYLAQSDVFIGIYGSSYGWIAPGEEISGLEDEYRLAPADTPKLIYIKDAAGRDDRLTALIARIQADDTAAYLHFTTLDELAEHVSGDLAMLLAERFEQSRGHEAAAPASAPLDARVPVPYTTTIGRSAEIAELRALLVAGDSRVVSLIGPGGVGKSRLAIEAARACRDDFPDGVYFVPLTSVADPDLLLPTLAHHLGIRETGRAAPEVLISQALDDRRVLIVLDNFEQIVAAAPALAELQMIAPRAVFLVTSRIVLRIRGERVREVRPLPAPRPDGPFDAEAAARSPAVQLFLDRARAIKPDLEVADADITAIADICRRLDGLPLAIELAAARIRVLTAADIARRLERSLSLLTGPGRDLPERHRTMTAAIEWSVGLLTDLERQMLEDLGVFAARFTLEAVDAVGAGRPWGEVAVDTLATLVDASLVQQTVLDGEAVFSLLVVVREYAQSRAGDADAVRRAHADHYLAFVERLAPQLRGPDQADAVDRLGVALPNLRTAVRNLVDADRVDEAARVARSLFVFWWISGLFGEVRLWMLEVLARPGPLAPVTRATALLLTLWGQLWRHPGDEIVAGLGECVELFEAAGDAEGAAMTLAIRGSTRMQLPGPDLALAEAEMRAAVRRLEGVADRWTEAMTFIGLGLLALVRGELDEAMARFERTDAIARAAGDPFTRIVAGQQRARLLIMRGDLEAAEEIYATTVPLGLRLHFDEGIAYALEGMSAIAVARRDARRAGTLAAAATSIRQRLGLFDPGSSAVRLPQLQELRETLPEEVAAGEREGTAMSVGDVIRVVLPDFAADAQPLLDRW